MVPSAIVVNFEPHLLRDAPTPQPRMWAELADWQDAYELCATTGKFADLGAMTLARWLPSYRARSEIRANLMGAFRGESSASARLVAMARRNRGMNRGALIMSRDLGNHQHDITTWGNPTSEPWRPDPANDRYARRLLRLAEERHIPVYAMLMPLAAGVQAKYESSGIAGRYVGWLRKLQARFPNLVVLDGRQTDYGPLAFFDALHLNEIGAAAVGAALGDHLTRTPRGAECDQRWANLPPAITPGVAVAVEDSAQSAALVDGAATRRR